MIEARKIARDEGPVSRMYTWIAILASFFMIVGAANVSAQEHMMKAHEGGEKKPPVEHPMMKPKMYSKVKHCNNCGMMINMWARTRHSYKHPEGEFTSCSIRCLADKVKNSSEDAKDVQVALYMKPEKMIFAAEAVYVIGSSAPGTMTMHSKIAFASNNQAGHFASMYGGKVVDFEEAFAEATMELPKSAVMIDKKRKKTGKIKEVTADTRCVVCGMKVANFPQHDSQVLLKDKSSIHFCSTQCLVKYNANPGQYVDKPLMSKMTWTKVYPEGGYESSIGLYYVVGSKIHGPMGKEAIPFRMKKAAEIFAAEEGGQIVSFKELVPSMVTN